MDGIRWCCGTECHLFAGKRFFEFGVMQVMGRCGGAGVVDIHVWAACESMKEFCLLTMGKTVNLLYLHGMILTPLVEWAAWSGVGMSIRWCVNMRNSVGRSGVVRRELHWIDGKGFECCSTGLSVCG